jgi:hypothetical protein
VTTSSLIGTGGAGGKDGMGGGVLVGNTCCNDEDADGGNFGTGGGTLFPPFEGIGGGPRPTLGTGIGLEGIGGGPSPPFATGDTCSEIIVSFSSVTFFFAETLSLFPAKQLSHTRCFFVA